MFSPKDAYLKIDVQEAENQKKCSRGSDFPAWFVRFFQNFEKFS